MQFPLLVLCHVCTGPLGCWLVLMWEMPPGVMSRMETWRSESFHDPGGEGLTNSAIAPFSAFCFWSNARPYSLSSSELDFLLFMGDLWCVLERHGIQFKRWLWNLVSFYYHGSYNFKSLYSYKYLIPTVDKKITVLYRVTQIGCHHEAVLLILKRPISFVSLFLHLACPPQLSRLLMIDHVLFTILHNAY